MRHITPKTKHLRCTEDATFEPITLEQAKLHARVDTDDDDALLTLMISAARQSAERKTGRVLRVSTWEWALKCGVYADLNVPLAPCSAVTAVAVDGTEVDSALYSVTPSGNGANEAPLLARLELLPGFPAGEEMTVTLTAGWPVDAIPTSLQQWMLTRVSTWYEQREKFVVGVNFNELGYDFIDSLLDPYIVPRSA